MILLRYFNILPIIHQALTGAGALYRFRADLAGSLEGLGTSMPEPDETGRGALRRLDRRLEAFEASRATKPQVLGMGETAGGGFRLLGQLLGGVLGGLGLGWLVDHFAHTAPFGIVGGLLIGGGLSIWAAVRTAMAMSAREAAKGPPAAPVADDEDDES